MTLGLFESGVPYQRMLHVTGSMQRYRMMRYVMVLGIILVTLFLYVSYYTTPMSVDSRYTAYVSQEQREISPPSDADTDQNFFAEAREAERTADVPTAVVTGPGVNTSGINVKAEEEQVGLPGDRSSSSASNAGGLESPVSSSRSSSNSSNKTQGDNAVASKVELAREPTEGVGEVRNVDRRSGIEIRNMRPDPVTQSKLTATANQSIIIPKVELPSKINEMRKLTGRNGTKPTSIKVVSKLTQLTGDVYEAGFSDPTPELCPNNGENLRLLALVHSAPNHVEARYAIRQTWGHYGTRRDIAIGFLVGRTLNAGIEANLTSEQFMYGDIVRSNSYDSYDNLTLKTISMLEWTDTYCSQARFLLKVDDDMFINVPKLLEFIGGHWNETRHIYGRLAKKWRPIRNKKSKYYVSPMLYAPKNFPDFVTGPSYLMTTDMIRELYEASLKNVFLKLEDVYMTGIVSQAIGAQRKHVNEFLNRRIAFNPCAIRKAISIHMVKGKEQFDLWKKLLDVDLKCK